MSGFTFPSDFQTHEISSNHVTMLIDAPSPGVGPWDYGELYALPGAMHSGFAQFAAFDQDALDNRASLANGKLTMPVLAVGGEKSLGPMMATVTRFATSDVHEAIVPDSGHWIMEENPQATIPIVRGFLSA